MEYFTEIKGGTFITYESPESSEAMQAMLTTHPLIKPLGQSMPSG